MEDTRDDTFLAQAVLVVVAVAVVFGAATGHGFVNLDDDEYVYENAHVLAGLTRESVAWAFTAFHSGHWHSLTWLSHMLDVELFGLHAGGHHAVNVLLHAVNAVLSLVLFRALLPGTWWPLAATWIFALHPLRVESVAWVTGRKDGLSMLFLLCGAWAWVAHARRPTRWSLARVTLFHALALLSKPLVITFPALLLVMDAWPLRLRAGEPTWMRVRHAVTGKWPLWTLSLVSVVITLQSQAAAGAIQDSAAVTWDARLGNALVASTSYAGLLAWPWNLGVFYPLRPVAPGAAAASALGLAVLLAWAWRRRTDAPWLLAGCAWFGIALSPTLGLLAQVGGQSMADRYAYIPSLGVALCVVAGVHAWWQHAAPRARTAVMVLGMTWGLVLAGMARQQVAAWKDSITLWNRTLLAAPDNFMAHNNLGVALEQAGRDDDATYHFEQAVRFHPGFPPALNNLGNALSRRGRYAEALPHYRRALEVRPSYFAARYHLGLALAFMGRNDEAQREWEQVVREAPAWPMVRLSLGDLLVRRGDKAAGITHLRAALELQPGWAEAQQRLDAALAGTR